MASPLEMEISNDLRTEKQLYQELFKQQKSYLKNQNDHEKIYFTYRTQEALINYFINKMITSKFLIEEIHPLQIRKHKNLIVVSFRLTLTGNIFQLKKLIDQLSEEHFLINIDEVIVEKANHKIVMKIEVFNISDAETKAFLKHLHVLQWIGYTENNKAIKGLLRLEDGNVLEVGAGSVINKSLKILEIKKDQMLVQVGNRKSMIQYGQFLEI